MNHHVTFWYAGVALAAMFDQCIVCAKSIMNAFFGSYGVEDIHDFVLREVSTFVLLPQNLLWSRILYQ